MCVLDHCSELKTNPSFEKHALVLLNELLGSSQSTHHSYYDKKCREEIFQSMRMRPYIDFHTMLDWEHLEIAILVTFRQIPNKPKRNFISKYCISPVSIQITVSHSKRFIRLVPDNIGTSIRRGFE